MVGFRNVSPEFGTVALQLSDVSAKPIEQMPERQRYTSQLFYILLRSKQVDGSPHRKKKLSPINTTDINVACGRERLTNA